MTTGRFHKTAIVIGHGAVGWAYCGALIGVGRQVLSMHSTLILHAIGAPVGFAIISRFYYRRFAYTSPVQTAAAFLGVVVFLDLFLVAPMFEKSYAMFSSILGTWIPFALIFAATYLAGRFSRTSRLPDACASSKAAHTESHQAKHQRLSWTSWRRQVLSWSRTRRNSASLCTSEPWAAAGSSRLQ